MIYIYVTEEATLPSSGATPLSLSKSTSYEDNDEENEDIQASPQQRRFSETDRHLLDRLNVGKTRIRHTGRFLTMHKRRRKKLATRSLNQDPGLLDDIFHGQVQVINLFLYFKAGVFKSFC